MTFLVLKMDKVLDAADISPITCLSTLHTAPTIFCPRSKKTAELDQGLSDKLEANEIDYATGFDSIPNPIETNRVFNDSHGRVAYYLISATESGY